MVSAKTEPFGSYAIERRIAVGGMAEVFAASSQGGAGAFVIKILLPQLARDEATLAAFAHEGRVGRVLRHEGIARVVDAGVVSRDGGDAHYLVIERVDGVLLSDLLATRKPLPFAAVAAWLIDLLDALAFAHGARDEAGRALGLVHRDVSPRNVFATRDGRAVLADFGIARSSLREDRTRTGAIRGTLGYLSPEQVTGSDVDARSDVFTAAVLAWELATAEPYVAAAGDLERIRASEDPPFRRPSSFGADPRLDGLLERALLRFPEERYPSARAFRDAVALALGPDAERAGRREVASRVAALAASSPAPRPDAPGDDAEVNETAGHPGAGAEALSRRPRARGSSRAPRRSLLWPAVGAASVIGLGVAAWRVQVDETPVPPTTPTTSPLAAPLGEPRSERTAEPPASAPADVTTVASVASVASAPSVAPSVVSGPEVAEPASGTARPRPPSSRADAPAPAVSAASPPSASPAAQPSPSATTAPTAEPAPTLPRRDLRKELDATNAMLRDARRRGQDTRAADARAAVALEALLDGRDADAERELAAIRALLTP